jgi:membrane protease YdiL (CAAX protease family)
VLPDSTPPEPRRDPSPAAQRIVALLEVLICSDFPTQLAIGASFNALGYTPFKSAGHLRVGYVVTLSLLDTCALVGLVFLFLHAHGERPRDIFLGWRPIRAEVAYGIPLILAAIAVGVGVLALIFRFVPSLRTVQHNPLQELLRSPRDAWLFAFVVIVAGGVREEIQRAFLLHRFRVWLGGGMVGLIVTSAAFGAGHALQGADAVIATGLLGAFWGLVYLRRGSVVAPMVSHAGFDLLQIVQYMTFGR